MRGGWRQEGDGLDDVSSDEEDGAVGALMQQRHDDERRDRLRPMRRGDAAAWDAAGEVPDTQPWQLGQGWRGPGGVLQSAPGSADAGTGRRRWAGPAAGPDRQDPAGAGAGAAAVRTPFLGLRV